MTKALRYHKVLNGRITSVLAKVDQSNVRRYPFPHLVLENALDTDIYEELAATFPNAERFLRGGVPEDNRYYWLNAREVLSGESIAKTWIDFVCYHTSRSFFLDVLRVFGRVIEDTYPALITGGTLLRKWSTSVRNVDPKKDLSLECQLTYCSPVGGTPSRSRGPHVDREVTLFGGLLYLRKTEDQSKGGNLVLHNVNVPSSELTFDAGNHLEDKFVKDFSVVSYKANTLVFFINSPLSIHSVTARSTTSIPRIHVNFVGELGYQLFTINKPHFQGANTNAWYGNE